MKRLKLYLKYWPAVITGVIVSVTALTAFSVYQSAHRPGHPDASVSRIKAPEEPLAFEFGTGRPVATYHMSHDREAIITVYWKAETWAHIEHFSSLVYPNEGTVLELEEPEPGLYPLTLDTGETLGYVQVD